MLETLKFGMVIKDVKIKDVYLKISNRHTSKMAIGIEILSIFSKIISVSFNAKKISFRFLF